VIESRPIFDGSSPKAEFRNDLPIEGMEHDMYGDGVRMPGIDSRRIGEIVFQAAKFGVPRSTGGVGEKPKNVLQQMRAGNARHLVPVQSSSGFSPVSRFVAGHAMQFLDMLRVEVNLSSAVGRKPLQLFYDASFRAMPAVEKRRNYRDAQFSVPGRRESVGEQLRIADLASGSVAETKFPTLTIDRHSSRSPGTWPWT
jgi:hypothetical protein